MKRRGFLSTTFAGGLAVTGTACATGRSGAATDVPLSEDELAETLARIDRVMDRMSHDEAAQWHLAKRGHERGRATQAAIHDGELLRASMRSAFLVSSVAELPEANHRDSRVLERLRGIADEADFAGLGTLAHLEHLDADELAALDREFAAADRPGMTLAEEIDELSEQLGVPSRRRLHLRRMAKHLDWRLERERFSDVVSDCVGRVDRLLDSLARSVEESTASLAFAGPDPAWAAKTRAVVRFYAPAEASEAAVPEAAEAEVDAGSDDADPVLAPSSSLVAPEPEVSPAPQASGPCQAELKLARFKAEEMARGKRFLGVGAGLLALGAVVGAVGLGVGFAVGSVALTVVGGLGVAAETHRGLGACRLVGRAVHRLGDADLVDSLAGAGEHHAHHVGHPGVGTAAEDRGIASLAGFSDPLEVRRGLLAAGDPGCRGAHVDPGRQQSLQFVDAGPQRVVAACVRGGGQQRVDVVGGADPGRFRPAGEVGGVHPDLVGAVGVDAGEFHVGSTDDGVQRPPTDVAGRPLDHPYRPVCGSGHGHLPMV